MSAYTPDSTVKFYQVDIDTNAGRTKVFNNAAAREHWFSLEGRTVATEVSCQVVKKRFQTIKSSIALATIQNCNYLSFINPSYGNKIFYCRIQSLDYVNNNTTLVSYTVDWWLTDMFNVVYDGCMVTREGLTNGEYTELSKNPYIDNLKMRTEEPLACTGETEPLRYKVAGTNAFCSQIDDGWDSNDGWNVFQQNDGVFKDGSNYMWTNTPVDTRTPNEEPFYVISFVGCMDVGDPDAGSQIELINAIFTKMRNYIDNGSLPPYLLVTPETFTITGGASMTYYAEGRHQKTADISYSDEPIHDTKQARPYYMVGCDDLATMKKVVDCFSAYDEVSSMLSFYSFPIYLLDEFIVSAFTDPAAVLLAENCDYLNIPYPTVAKTVRQTGDSAYGGRSTEISPKLFRFPFAYASLEGVNGSGHIELQYEKMGKKNPMLTEAYSSYASGVRVDSNGRPTYFTLKKWVSITADGIYIGVAPVDYEARIDGSDDLTYTVKSDLAHGVFYTEFPQVPFNSDAYLEFLGSQAKNSLVQETRLAQAERAFNYDQLYRQGTSNVLGAVGGVLGGVGQAASGNYVGGATSIVGAFGNYSIAEANRQQQMDLIQKQADLAIGANEYMGNPQEPNALTENYANAKAAFVTPNFHAGSCGGILNLLQKVQPVGVYLMMRRRSEAFINAYNEFFKNYGYATNMYKEPSIKYITNNNDTAIEAPHLENASSGGSAKWGQFYTRTENLRVHGVCGESASFIENLYNGGCLFSAFIYTPA